MPKPTSISASKHMLEVITDTKIPHKRRAAMARRALKSGTHVMQAAKTLRSILKKPDGTLTPIQLDAVVQSLNLYAPPGPVDDEVLFCDEGFGRIFYEWHIKAGGKGRLVSVEEYDALSPEEKLEYIRRELRPTDSGEPSYTTTEEVIAPERQLKNLKNLQ